MKEEQKKNILDKYKIALGKGERFWPDSIYKDLLVSFAIFIVLILLATFVGVPGEPKADPSDTAYVPKPEWYFLFLFKFLALYGQIPWLGKIEWIATAVIPVIAILALFLLPFLDRNPHRYYSRRVLSITVMGVVIVDMVALTLIANIPTVAGSQGLSIMTLFQSLAGLVIPGVALLVLYVLSFAFRRNSQASVRVMPWVGGAAVVGIILLTAIVMATAPPAAPTETAVAGTLTEQIALGQDLFSINCVECHGAEGEGGEIKGVEGLEGFQMKAIHSQDEMYTRDDTTLADIIAYGQPNLGMQPFGKAYGGELAPSDIDAIVAFMRYTWDDRAELPPGTKGLAAVPVPAPGEVASYDVYIQALTKRYCVSCHRQGKQNNNYLMTSYDEMLNSGDNAPVMKAGDPNSLMIQLITGHESKDPKTGKVIRQMPPTKLLDQKYVDMLTLWIMNGMPKTADEAAKLSATPTPAGTPAPSVVPTSTP